MIIFVNNKNEIKDVESTNLEGLTALEIDDTDNPFKKWSKAKICCYKATVIGGKVTMMTPYLDSRLIEHIEQLGNQTEENAEGVEINGGGLFDVADVVDQNNTAIFELADFIADLMARVEALEGGV
jgi:hypothetical protein